MKLRCVCCCLYLHREASAIGGNASALSGACMSFSAAPLRFWRDAPLFGPALQFGSQSQSWVRLACVRALQWPLMEEVVGHLRVWQLTETLRRLSPPMFLFLWGCFCGLRVGLRVSLGGLSHLQSWGENLLPQRALRPNIASVFGPDLSLPVLRVVERSGPTHRPLLRVPRRERTHLLRQLLDGEFKRQF